MESLENRWTIYKEFGEVEKYVDTLSKAADENRDALGFLPRSVYLEQALVGRVWVAVDQDSGEYAGHLIFGGRFPSLKVIQAFVAKQHRRSGVGELLIRHLVSYGEAHSYLTITARVAADLAANKFWERQGLELVRQEPGGKTTKRTINVRAKELATPSLFGAMGQAGNVMRIDPGRVGYTNRPLSSTPSYAIDLNVFFDVTRDRERADEAELLFGAALSNHVKICVTSEFLRELERRSVDAKNDPILAFARSLPRLPDVQPNLLEPLTSELRHAVFREKSKLSENDISDLRHLAECIHHRVSGFVTGEKNLLTASNAIREAYGLDVTSVSDLSFSVEDVASGGDCTHAAFASQHISLVTLQEIERSRAEKFLVCRGVSQDTMSFILNPGVSSAPRRRLIATVDGAIVAVASWDVLTKFRKRTILYLVVDESHPSSTRIIDHILESVLRDSEARRLNRVDLVPGPGQVQTIETAIQRGFRRRLSEDGSSFSSELSKISFNGMVTPKIWSEFAASFCDLSGLALPKAMPKDAELMHTGIVARTLGGRQSVQFSLFEFETLISPGMLVFKSRDALILPVLRRYAKDMFSAYGSRYELQAELFPGKEALIHTEKSYFRSQKNTGWFKRGMPVVFYVSGKGGGQKAAIGVGRVTFSDKLTLEEIEINLTRQGVLDLGELNMLATGSRDHKIHAFTFDNFSLFPTAVPFKRLKELGVVSDANLVTVQKLPKNGFSDIIEEAFGL